MLKTAIAVDADLASRIAVRYACQMGRFLDLDISTLHAADPGEQGQAIATGWVRRKWEDAVVRDTMDQVVQLVKAEQAGCRILAPPLFLPPEQPRDERLARHLRSNRYGLFVEGLLHRFKPDHFMAKIGSRLYRNLPCPAMVAQNVPPPSKGVLWVSPGKIAPKSMENFLGIFPSRTIELSLLNCRFGNKPVAPSDIEAAVSLFESSGGAVTNISTVEGSPSSMAALVRDHFLIVSEVPPAKGPMAELLSKSPCSLLLIP